MRCRQRLIDERSNGVMRQRRWRLRCGYPNRTRGPQRNHGVGRMKHCILKRVIHLTSSAAAIHYVRILYTTCKFGDQSMDFMLKFIGSAPSYFTDLISFLTGPRRFLASRIEASRCPDPWPQALSFFACSGLIMYALHAAFKFLPLAQNPNFNGLLITILMTGAGVFFLALAAKISWRAVGGSIPFVRVLLIEIYIFAVAMVIGNMTSVMMTGFG